MFFSQTKVEKKEIKLDQGGTNAERKNEEKNDQSNESKKADAESDKKNKEKQTKKKAKKKKKVAAFALRIFLVSCFA